MVRLLSLSLLIAFAACDVRNVSPTADEVAEQVLALSGESQRLAFATLSPDQAARTWAKRFEKIRSVTEGAGKTGNAGIRDSLIQEFVAFASNENDIERSMRDSIYFNNFFRSWINGAQKHFSGIEIYNLAYSLREVSALQDTMGLGGLGLFFEDGASKAQQKVRNCGKCCCSTGSAWTCPNFSLSVKDAGVTYGECWGSGCNSGDASSWGCGGAFMQSCDGGQCTW